MSHPSFDTGEEEQLQELSEAIRHEEEERFGEDEESPPALHMMLDEVVDRVSQHSCVAVFVFDASRLGGWERQYGASAFDAIIRRLYRTIHAISHEALGEDVLVCLDADGGDTILVFPDRGGASAEVASYIDLEDQLYHIDKELLQRLATHQLWFHEALEAVTSGSSVILHNGTVDPRRAVYRAIRKATHDARIAHGEVQRKRNRIVGHVIAHRKIRTYYQPIVSLSADRPFGYEALSRPREREARKLGVHLFVAASRAELDGELDAICRALSVSRRPAISAREHLFINCLPPAFYDDMSELEEILAQWLDSGMQPEQLVFEVNENITRKQASRMMRNVRALRARGYRFALDDVGTGTSNLQLLADLEPDFIKMDMSLTIGIAQSERKRELASYLLELARRFDGDLIAEGIETPEDLATVRELGIDLGQGFLLGRPAES